MSEDNELGGEDAEGDEVVDGGTSAGESAGDRHDRVTADPDAECGGGDGVHEESQAEPSTLDGGRQPPGRSSGELDLPAVDSEWGDVIGQELSAAQFGRAVEWIGARIDGTHAKAVSQRILHLLHAADLHQRTRMLLCTAVTIAVTHTTTAGLRDGASVTQQVGAVSGLLKLLNQRPVGTQIAQPLFVNQLVQKANDVPASDEATYLAGLGLELPLSVEDQQRARMRLHIILRNATRGAGCHGRPLTPAEVLQARVDMERAGCLHECKTQGRMLTVGYAADGHGTYQIRQQKRRVVAGAPGLCVTSQE
jgi:hypothetical protein